MAELPHPPFELANYVGGLTDADPWWEYEWIGAMNRQLILSFLPEDWSFEGRRVLDFGGGSGRVIRHFIAEAQEGEFWCCDIDAPSIEWAQANLSPPFRFFRNAEWPPLDQPDASFDLIYGNLGFHAPDRLLECLAARDASLAAERRVSHPLFPR
jgi:ubiquinone/menaquinone biosynthesis C-methylase UbiE